MRQADSIAEIKAVLASDSIGQHAILDRLMHRSHLLEFEGKSYRLKEAATRFAQNTSTSS